MKNSLLQKELESHALITTKTLFKGKIFSVKQDSLTIGSDSPHAWDLVIHPGAVAGLPVNKNGDLILIQQWRRAIEQIIYEVPAGTLNPNESPIDCMARELQEEIGFKPKKLVPFGGYYPSPGFSDEYVHFFLAKDLVKSPLPKDTHEAIDVVALSLSQALKLIDRGEIQDGKTIALILRYEREINRA